MKFVCTALLPLKCDSTDLFLHQATAAKIAAHGVELGPCGLRPLKLTTKTRLAIATNGRISMAGPADEGPGVVLDMNDGISSIQPPCAYAKHLGATLVRPDAT